jgi:uncharacterized membrane protein YdjX (TVP38/TMEM64 family)
MLKKYEKILEYAWFVVLVLLFIISVQMIKSGSLVGHIGRFGILAPVIFVLLKISTLVIAPLGGTPLYLVAGSLFGNTQGFLLALLGDCIGTSICFALSRKYGEKIIYMFVGEKYVQKIRDIVSILTNTSSVIKSRIVFGAMPEILAYASGLSKVSFKTFFLINTVFYAVTDLILVFFGREVTVLISQHAVWFYVILAIIVLSGLWLLHKDYKNTQIPMEGM